MARAYTASTAGAKRKKKVKKAKKRVAATKAQKTTRTIIRGRAAKLRGRGATRAKKAGRRR